MLNLNNVSYAVPDRTIIDGTSLQVPAGEHLLLLGPSGCGKTTLMNLMAGLLKPTSGDISFGEKNYSSLSTQGMDDLRAKNFGFIFQRLHLIGYLNVLQNIALAQQKTNLTEIQDLAKQLNLSDIEKQKAQNISVGEAQRVAIARAVANKPKIIFADEPTSALDDENISKVTDLLFSQAEKSGASIIAATHDARIKQYFTNVLEMDA